MCSLVNIKMCLLVESLRTTIDGTLIAFLGPFYGLRFVLNTLVGKLHLLHFSRHDQVVIKGRAGVP